MSGGHFDYQDHRLDDIADQIKKDIDSNDVTYEEADKTDSNYGFQYQKETLGYMNRIAEDLYSLRKLLRAYDYAVSRDSSEIAFLEAARNFYGSKK